MTAAWLTWGSSIREKRDLKRFPGVVFRSLAAAIALLGFTVLCLSTTVGSGARAVFLAGISSVGLITGSNMLMLARRGPVNHRWWLAQHLNGATLNFAATHGSFFGIGLVKLLPVLPGEWLHTFSQLSIIVLAFVLRVYIGRRVLRCPSRIGSESIRAVDIVGM